MFNLLRFIEHKYQKLNINTIIRKGSPLRKYQKLDLLNVNTKNGDVLFN